MTTLTDMIKKMVKWNVENHYKTEVLRKGNENYITSEQYSKKYSQPEMFKLSVFYREYNEWVSSEEYDCVMKKVYYDYIKYEVLSNFNDRAFGCDIEKLDYLTTQYDNDVYYPDLDGIVRRIKHYYLSKNHDAEHQMKLSRTVDFLHLIGSVSEYEEEERLKNECRCPHGIEVIINKLNCDECQHNIEEVKMGLDA